MIAAFLNLARCGLLLLLAAIGQAARADGPPPLSDWLSRTVNVGKLAFNEQGFTLVQVSRPVALSTYIHYWLIPCPQPSVSGAPNAYSYHLNLDAFDGRVRIGQQGNTDFEQNGNLLKLSNEEKTQACASLAATSKFTKLAYANYLDSLELYALNVEYSLRDATRESWNNSVEMVSARIVASSPSGAKQSQDIYYVDNIPGSCQPELDALKGQWTSIKASSDAQLFTADGDIILQTGSAVLVSRLAMLKSRGLDGACNGSQLSDVEQTSLALLAVSQATLQRMRDRDNANAAALDTLHNMMIASEQCLVRGAIKIASKLAQQHPGTMAAYKLVDSTASASTGLTLMEHGVKWGDMALAAVGAGEKPEGCSAQIVSTVCRVATDALWNKGTVNVRTNLNARVGERTKTIKWIDNFHWSKRPGYSLPANQSVAVALKSKGFMGLNGITATQDLCTGARQLYFSTVGTVIRDVTGDVIPQCFNVDTKPAKQLVTAYHDIAIYCSGIYASPTGSAP